MAVNSLAFRGLQRNGFTTVATQTHTERWSASTPLRRPMPAERQEELTEWFASFMPAEQAQQAAQPWPTAASRNGSSKRKKLARRAARWLQSLTDTQPRPASKAGSAGRCAGATTGTPAPQSLRQESRGRTIRIADRARDQHRHQQDPELVRSRSTNTHAASVSGPAPRIDLPALRRHNPKPSHAVSWFDAVEQDHGSNRSRTLGYRNA